MTSRIVVALFVLAVSGTSVVSAQGAGTEIVRTRDGGMYRGTVIESVPGSHVVLLSPTGETRRFEAADVESVATVPVQVAPPEPVQAPPSTVSAAIPSPAQPSVDANGNRQIRLHIEGDEPGQTLMLQSGLAAIVTTAGAGVAVGFNRLCTAPCDITLPAGNHSFAVEDQRGRTRGVRRPIMLEHDGVLSIGVDSRRRQRIIRWVTSLGLMAVSAPIIVASMKLGCDDYYDECYVSIPGLVIGSAMASAGYSLLFAAIFTFDRGRVEYAQTP